MPATSSFVSHRTCRWCERRPTRQYRKQCSACEQQRRRFPRCPHCDGPTYGHETDAMRRFCPRCSPYRPERLPYDDEIVVTLVNPAGKEREVYRSRNKGEHIPASGRSGGRAATKRDPQFIVLDVAWQCWLAARPT